MQNNLHVTMNSLLYASRLFKETESLVRSGLVGHVYIIGLLEEGLSEHETIDAGRSAWRIPLKSRQWPRNLGSQLIKYVEFCWRVIRFARSKKTDVVNVHYVALLPLGALVKRFCGAQLVYDTHELETESYDLSGFRKFAAQQIERLFIRYADLVIVVGDGIKAWYCDKYRISNVVTVLNCPKLQEPQRGRLFHQELHIPEDRKIVLYQGACSRGRGIEQLLRVFAEYDDKIHVLVLMGFGELEPLIKHYAGSHANIYFREAADPDVVLQYTASAHVGVAYIDNPSLNDHFCLPNKLFEYIMAGIPVMVNNVPEMRRVVNENQLGVVLEELTPASLARALDYVACMDPVALSTNLRRVAQESSWNCQEQKMISAYKQYVMG